MASRRGYLAGLAAASLAGLAGCSGVVGTGPDVAADGDDGGTASSAGAPTDGSPPLADDPLTLGHETEHLRGETSRGAAKDGIPSIDDPQFVDPDEFEADDGDPVFGLTFDGETRAYPQSVLVWHEIVNDVAAGVPISVTYCPLTGTAMGFYRGDTTFGVSGRLVNNNLVMYDRANDGRWPQVTGTAIEGPHEGESLREFRLVWTTWGRWRDRHPETRVLSTETGYARDYGSDPYGGYNPRSGYYARDHIATLFPDLVDGDDRLPKKAVVLGARTTAGAVAFEKAALRDESVLTADLAGDEVAAVYDAPLDTGYVYRTGGASVEAAGEGRVRVDGEVHAADAVPLDRAYAFDAMWFAWHGFYPETGLVTA